MSSKKDVSIQQRVCEPIVSRGLESLRRIDFFRALKEPVLRMIAVKLQVCFLAPEELLAREGERVDRLWFMGKGTADAVVHGKKVITMEALQQCFATFPDDSGIFRQLVEDRIEKDASKRIPWTSQEEEASEELQQEFSLLPRSYVRQFVKDYDRIEFSERLTAAYKQFLQAPV
eukprot:g18122.t1